MAYQYILVGHGYDLSYQVGTTEKLKQDYLYQYLKRDPSEEVTEKSAAIVHTKNVQIIVDPSPCMNQLSDDDAEHIVDEIEVGVVNAYDSVANRFSV